MKDKISILTDVSQEEKLIVKMLAEDNRAGEIAKRMKINVMTFGGLLSDIRNKFSCKTNTGLVSLFIKNKII